MAEFSEVMKQAKRMCGSMDDCNDCPFAADGLSCGYAHLIDDDKTPEQVAEFERIVMDWAAANPEPRYPTWKEWQDTNFPNNDALMRPCIFESEEYFNCKSENGCENCMNKPIPPTSPRSWGLSRWR